MRIMGKRQIGELEVSELVTTLLVSEVASLPIADQDIPLFSAIIPLFLIVCLEIIISFIKNKSEKIKRLVEGVPVFIIYQGKLRQDVLSKNRISINELLSEMRTQGIGDIREVYYAILEQTGKLSILKKNDNGSTTHPVVIDTELDKTAIRDIGVSEEWVIKKMAQQGLSLGDVFLMTVDDKKDIYIIRKEK